MDFNATASLKVAAFQFPPFSEITADGNVIGPGAVLWRYVAIPLKINWTWELHGFPQFGAKGDDGKWSGIFGYIQNNEVDLLLIDSYTKYDRLSDMEFSSPFTFAYTTILSSALGSCESSKVTSSFPDPSTPVLAVLLFTLLTVTMFRIAETNLLRKNGSDVLKYLVESFMILLRQPIHKLPSTIGSQLVLGFYLLSFIVLINLYLSEMKAEMTLCDTSIPETLEDILKNPKSLPSVPRNLPEFFDMRNSKDSLIRRVWEKVAEIPGNGGILEGDYMEVERVKRTLLVEKRIVIGTKEYMENKLTEHCQSKEAIKRIGPEMKLRLSREKFFLKPVTLAFRLNMDKTLMGRINNRITRFASTGLWLYNERTKDVVLSKCLDRGGRSNVVRDNITSIRKTFLAAVWGTGILTAFLCLVVEYLRNRYVVNKNNATKKIKSIVANIKDKDKRVRHAHFQMY